MSEVNNILRDFQFKYEFLINSITDVIIEIDLDGTFTYVSPQIYDMFGYKPEEIIEKKFSSFIHPDDLSKITGALSEIIKSNEIFSLEYRVKHKKGHYVPISARGSLVKVKDKLKLIGILRDITEKKLTEQKLIESEEKYRELFEQSLVGCSIVKNTQIIAANKALLDLFGYDSLEEYIKKSIFDHVAPESMEATMKRYRKMQKGISVDPRYELKFLRKDGTIIEVEANYNEILIGNETYTQTTFHDITERKKTEEDLRLHSEIMTNLAEGVYLIRLEDGTIVYANPIFEEMFGYEPGEMIGKYVAIVNAPTDKTPEETKQDIEGILRETGEWHGEVKNIKKDGTPFWCYANVSLFDHPEYGTVIISVHTDITDRKMTTQKLKESEKKYHELFENSPSSILLIDLTGIIVDCNYATEAVTGYNKKDLLGNSFTDFNFLNKDIFKKVMEKFSLLVDGKNIHRLEIPANKKDGTPIWIMARGSLISIEEKILIQIIFHDITERKKVERELMEISRLKSELLERTSHELKTPLISIKGFTDLLLNLHNEKFDDDTISILGEIKQGSERLESIINKLLETSYLESRQVQLNPTKEDLMFLIKFCVKDLRGLAKMRNHFIQLNILAKLKVIIEKERIYDVITHLIINAIKYTPPYGEIKIESKIINNFIIISVEDNGIGLSDDDQKKIFKRFGKIERYGQGWDIGIEGTGMGLYTAKKIIELHGGKIWAESNGRNKGSKFYFSLPIIKE